MNDIDKSQRLQEAGIEREDDVLSESAEGVDAIQGEEAAKAEDAAATSEKVKRGKHSKGEEEPPEYMKRSRRMRKILMAVIIVLIIIVVAVCVLGFLFYDTARNAATQQTQTTTTDVDQIETDEATKDASSLTSKRTTVPDLVGLLGLNQEQALEKLQHGAQVTGLTEVNEDGNPVRLQVDIALSDEPADSRSGTPSVYLELNEEGVTIRAGYSVATSSIGYGSLSFSDAVTNENIIEHTVEEAGLVVANHTAILPEDRMLYSTYAGDGTTLVREYCEFSGTGEAGGVEHAWDAALSYDYNMANATGNLADTIRTIYVYIAA